MIQDEASGVLLIRLGQYSSLFMFPAFLPLHLKASLITNKMKLHHILDTPRLDKMWEKRRVQSLQGEETPLCDAP